MFNNQFIDGQKCNICLYFLKCILQQKIKKGTQQTESMKYQSMNYCVLVSQTIINEKLHLHHFYMQINVIT